MLRGYLTATLAIICALLLTACGGDDEPAPYTPLTQAGFAKAITDAMAGHSTYHMHMEEGTESMDVDVSLRKGGAMDMSGTMKDDDGPASIVLSKGQIYVKDSGAKRWKKFPPAFSAALLGSLSEGNPRDVARDFGKGMKTFTYVGEEEIDGVRVHRYDITMKPAFVRKKLAAKAAQAGQELPAGFKVPKFTYEIVVDDQNLMRRLSVTTAGTTVGIDMSKWGEPVSVKAPPASKVDELPAAS